LIANSSCPTGDNQIKNSGLFLTELLRFEVVAIRLKTELLLIVDSSCPAGDNQIKNSELLLIADSSCCTGDNQIKNSWLFLTELLRFEAMTIRLKTLSCFLSWIPRV